MGANKPFAQMSVEEMRAWIQQTRVKLQQKLQRERTYLNRRAAQGIHTPTDDAYETDMLLEFELLSLLDELEASL